MDDLQVWLDAHAAEAWLIPASVIPEDQPDERLRVFAEVLVAFEQQAVCVDPVTWEELLVRVAAHGAWHWYLAQEEWQRIEPFLQRTAHGVLSRERDAWEAAADVVFGLVTRLLGGQQPPSSHPKVIPAWLRRSVFRDAVSELRRRHGTGAVKRYAESLDPEVHFWVEDAETPMPEEFASWLQRSDALHAAVEALPERLRVVIELMYFRPPRKRTYQQVADELGIAKDTVKVRLRDALKSLREALAWLQDDPAEAPFQALPLQRGQEGAPSRCSACLPSMRCAGCGPRQFPAAVRL